MRFEESCRERKTTPADEINALLGPGGDPDGFWQRVKINLQAGRVRLVFVADEIPPELRRIVEFLNGQMDPAEVLAVEIKQFVGQGLKTLVPRVIGQTVEAERKKGGTAREEKQWDEGSFLTTLEKQHGREKADVARTILAWAKTKAVRLWWGKGSVQVAVVLTLDHKGTPYFFAAIWFSSTLCKVEIQFQWLKERPAFAAEAKRIELRDKLNSVPGVNIGVEAITKRPSIPLSMLQDEATLRQFLGVLDWVAQEVLAT
jgi:hypothetical protein